MLDTIRQLSETYFDDTRNARRHLHAHPELSYQEVNTAKFVAKKLTEYGMAPAKGIAKTGVVAMIEGKNA
ncbi:MAG TPA: amidohydrolase, partial [Cyclobacteriaceae bacterium]|nr:amidohydrolase [Cyclobacteriaceae bacterium]